MASIHRTLLLSLLIVLPSCGGSSGDGSNAAMRSAEPDPRIVNGTVIGQDQLPFVKRLGLKLGENIQTICSGSFISPNHFLTAAHCILGPQVDFGPQPTEAFFVEIEPGLAVPAAGLAVHPSYTGQTASIDVPGLTSAFADIAIVLIATPYTGPLVPVSTRVPSAGQVMVIAGYGRTGTSIAIDEQLRVGPLTVDFVSVNDGTIYSVFEQPEFGESGPCSGDSGGPELIQFGPEEPFVLVGVTSGGGPACEAPALIANTLVPANLDFINLITGGQHAQL